MIFGHIANTAFLQHPAPIADAIAYFQRTNFSAMPAGDYQDPVTGYPLEVMDLYTQSPDMLRPSVHRQNVDVQLMVSGTELIGVVADSGSNPVYQDFLAQRDVLIYQDVTDESWLTLHSGNFAVFFPQDVHRPACINQRPCMIRKVVMKIPLASFNT